MSRRRQRRPQPTTDQRTPDERLEALVRERSPERASRTLARIRDDLDARPEPGPWIAAARTLGERLIISDDAVHYFTELFTECLLLAASESDAELLRLRSEMESIERAHGLRDGDYWRADEAPADWQTLNEAWENRAEEIIGAALRDLGHADMAALRATNRAEFERKCDKGRIDLWGEDEADDDFDD